MGHVYITMKIGKRKAEKMLIDTGSWFTIVPPRFVAGAKYLGKQKVEMGNRKMFEMDIYSLPVSYGKRRYKFAQIATFKNAPKIVGVQTLEGLGLQVDPTGKKVVQTRPPRKIYFYRIGKVM